MHRMGIVLRQALSALNYPSPNIKRNIKSVPAT